MTEADLPDIATLELGGSRGPTGWIEWNRSNYADHGFGLWIIETHSGEFVGDCGLTMQEVEGEWLVEAGWHVRSSLRRQGYAAEAAAAVVEAARGAGIDHLIAIIRPDNVASQGVAAKIGLALEREVHKNGGPALVFGADLTLNQTSALEREPLVVGAGSHDQYAVREATEADADQMAVVEALARQILVQEGVDLNALTAPQGFQEATSWTLALALIHR